MPVSPRPEPKPSLNPATKKPPTECPHCGCKRLTRKGVREKKLERVQLWQCTYCRRVFTPAPHSARNTTYPPRVIFDAITTYNLGYSLAETAQRIRASRGVSITTSSLSRWLAAHRSTAAYARLRARGLALFPACKTICALKLYHRQVYEYAYHRPKLALLARGEEPERAGSRRNYRANSAPARFAPLADFLERVPERCPHALFRASARASQANAPAFIAENKRVAVRKENTATRIAALILPTVGWRDRIDRTSNWAITVVGAMLSVSLSTPTAHHGVILFAMVLVLFLLVIESRRYRFFDVYRARVRSLERHYYAQVFSAAAQVESDWTRILSNDLTHPVFLLSLGRAISRRLSRNYCWMFLILLLAWLLKITSPTLRPDGEAAFVYSLTEWVRNASIGPLPGKIVIGIVLSFYGWVLYAAIRHYRDEGELAYGDVHV